MYIYQLISEPLEDKYFSSLNKAVKYCRDHNRVYHSTSGDVVNEFNDGKGSYWVIFRYEVR